MPSAEVFLRFEYWRDQDHQTASCVMKLRPTFAATLCLVALTNPLTQLSSQPLPALESILKQVLAKAENEQDNDRQFRRRYAYTRTRVTEYRDAKGQLKRRQEKTGRNAPRPDRPVSGPERSDTNRNSSSLTRPPNARNVEGRAFEKSDFVLDADLVTRFQFTLLGRESLHGRSVLIIDFHPARKDLPVRSFQDRFLNKAAGRVWVDELESVVVKADLYLTDRVSVAGGLVGAVGKFSYQFDRERTPDGLWFTRQVKWHLEGRQILVQKVIDHFEEKKDIHQILYSPDGRIEYSLPRAGLPWGEARARECIRSDTRPSEQRSPKANRPLPQGLQRFWLVASWLVGLQSAAAMLPSSRLATSQNRSNKLYSILPSGEYCIQRPRVRN
jgi:hypothetical protein